MRIALQALIPVVRHSLTGVVSLSTSSSPNNTSTTPLLTAKDRVLARRCATNRAIQHLLLSDDTVLRQSILSDENLVKALNNYGQIFDMPVSAMLDYAVSSKQDMRAWSNLLKQHWEAISRGSDLFVKGLGRFNIPETYDKVVAYRQSEWKKTVLQYVRVEEMKKHCKLNGIRASNKTRRELEIALAERPSVDVVQIALEALRAGTLKSNNFPRSKCVSNTPAGRQAYLFEVLQGESSKDGLPYWLVTATMLQVWGYFGDALEKMPNEEVQFVEARLGRVLDLSEDSPQRIHLIRYHISWSEQENLASLDEIRTNNGYAVLWPDGWERMKPSTLLSTLREHKREKELARHGGDVTYSHLSDLEDAGSLRVLRTRGEVMDVGRTMKNCALNYAKDVALGHCILIAKYDNVKKNKSIALGMINRNGNILSKGWSQIYMSCNRAAPEEVKQEFYDYERVLRPWFRKKYIEKNGNE